MSTKRLVTTSIFALVSASAVQAADVMIPHQPTPVASSTFVAPAFSWTGLYLGGQVGGFSSKADMSIIGKHKTVPLSKDLSPKLSGFEGGVFAGSNIDLGDNFVLGIDTDFIWSGQKHSKTITISAPHNATIDGALARARRSTSATPTTTPTPTSTEVPPSPPQTAAAKPVPVKPAPAQPVLTKPVASQSASVSTQTPPAQPAVGSETPKAPAVQSAAGRSASSEPAPAKPASAQTAAAKSETIRSSGGTVETTVPTQPLVLARSGSGAVTGQPAASGEVVTSGARAPSRSSYSAYGSGASSSGAHSQAGAHHRAHAGSGVYPHGASGSGAHGVHPHVGTASNPHGPHLYGSHSHAAAGMAGGGAQAAQAANKNDAAGVYGIEQIKEMASELGIEREGEVATLSHTLKQNWSGATRVRIGFAADRFMPYIAGGIAYAQLQDAVSVSFKKEGGKESSKNLTDETKTMIGYTLGGGVDFAVLDNVIVRAEYRYSDFGKKKFAKEKLELSYKTNDFRVGVAYKF
ncbi:opacity protein-like surface antigen [Bartonella silvatica]|uniref:Porin n=1 Tax=Bartonella silvatica TaxID=357760 RepID=A0ABV2HGG4_9HYPH